MIDEISDIDEVQNDGDTSDSKNVKEVYSEISRQVWNVLQLSVCKAKVVETGAVTDQCDKCGMKM